MVTFVDQEEFEPMLKRRSVFTVGQRRRMNIIPIFLNVFIPWFMFCGFFALFSFKFFHLHSNISLFILELSCSAVLILVGLSVWSSRVDMDPMWYKFAIIVLFVAIFSGASLGYLNYLKFMLPYYENSDLKSLTNVSPSELSGADLLDAGRVYWAENTALDLTRSWHFKHGDTYCVAPIVTMKEGSAVAPQKGSLDFWAVGVNCCAVDASDFRCGAFADATVRASIRLTDAESRPFFRLAVQQAETLFDVLGSQPIFFHWVADPLAEMLELKAYGQRMLVVAYLAHFVFSVTAVALATCRFAFLGRGKQ